MAARLETVVGPRGVRLSGGQVQRVAAGRAFARRPDRLGVDDPASALAARPGRLIWERVFSDPGVTVLAVFAPLGSLATCRPGGRAEGWPRRGSGHSQRAASLQ